jgi:hypothetical protein
VIVEPLLAAVITRSFFSLLVLGYVPARSLLCNLRTLTGEVVKSWFAARGYVMIGCLYLTMWGKL